MFLRFTRTLKFASLSLCLIAIATVGAASTSKKTDENSSYNQPPQNILDIMRAPAPPVPLVSPTRDRILLVAMEEYPSIERVALPYLRLAGVRIEPKNRSKHDTPGGYGIAPCVQSLDLVQLADHSQKSIDISKLSCADGLNWSADGQHFAFTDKTEDAVELWIGDAKTAKISRISGVKLNPMMGDVMRWMPDQKNLLVKLVPKGAKLAAKTATKPATKPAAKPATKSAMKAAEIEASTQEGPSIQETSGEKGQSSTYERRDTLSNKHDEDLFDFYGTSQLALVNVLSGTVTVVGTPAIYDDADPSPDGTHLLISEIIRPYSYLTTSDRFPKKVEIWNIANLARIGHHLIADLPLADRVPVRGVPLGPRDFSWRPNRPATVIWAEALDGGDWNVKVASRDKVMLSEAPFEAAPAEIFRLEQRYAGLDWLEQGNLAFLTQYDENKHWVKTFIVNADDPKQAKQLLWDHSTDEKYAHPGLAIHNILPNGFAVVRVDHDSIFLTGMGSSDIGDRPFLDRLDLRTLKTERLFRSDKAEYERYLSFSNNSGEGTFLTWHQSPKDPPNVYLQTIGESREAPTGEAVFQSTSVSVTHIPDPTPQVRDIQQKLVKYKRADGVGLSFTLYTPPGYKEGTRVPTILYAYPLDYADASMAGQVTGSQSTFNRLRNYKLLLMAGYAIIDRAAFPIVGDPKKAYDTYLDQLVADAKAAVDEAIKIGVADPNRIGVTGHSHGALMTANLVAHSDLFRAGAATSGSYNKTLTAFGFQSERRSLWDAPEVYRKVSPFFFADKLKTPLLIVHGAEDANPGTTPLQASLLYEAIRGNGGTARLVLLPHEPHWYAARESNEQLIYEMISWFDKYVKNAVPRQAQK